MLRWVVREPKDVLVVQPEDSLAFRIVRRATASDLGRCGKVLCCAQ